MSLRASAFFAHGADHFRRRADEIEPARHDRLGELRVLGEEARSPGWIASAS